MGNRMSYTGSRGRMQASARLALGTRSETALALAGIALQEHSDGEGGDLYGAEGGSRNCNSYSRAYTPCRRSRSS